MTHRKKILFIARWYPDRNDNMYGLFVQKHAQAVQKFHDVRVLYVTADPSLPAGKILKEENEFHGIREYKIYFGKHSNEIFNAVAFAKHYIKGVKWIRDNSWMPDLVHVHILSRTAFPALWLKITKGTPYIITEHWSRYLTVNLSNGSYRGWLRKAFTKIAVSKAYAVTTVTQNLADAMKKLGLQNNYFITPNVADINDFRPALKNEIRDSKKLIHISCFDEPAKNIKGIIDTIGLLHKKRNDFTLEIVGTGIDFEMVKQHAASSGLLDKTIFFTGLLTGDLLSKKLRESVALVMFSNYENLPCTIVESLCSGVPVISTDVGGISEHVSDKNGYLIAPRDVNALAEALNKMLDHSDEFNADELRNYAVSKFSMDAVGIAFSELYSNALHNN